MCNNLQLSINNTANLNTQHPIIDLKIENDIFQFYNDIHDKAINGLIKKNILEIIEKNKLEADSNQYCIKFNKIALDKLITYFNVHKKTLEFYLRDCLKV